MKSIRYFTGILFLFIGWATLAQVSQNINFSINEVFTGQTNGLDWVKLENASLLYGQDFVGQPQLPVVSVNLALPKGQKANSVTVSSNQQTTLSGNFNLVKVQEPEELGFPKNESEYRNSSEGNPKSSTNLFPDDPLVNFTNHQYREYSYVTVRFIPFSYNEQTGKLDLITQVSISVNSSGADLAMLHSLRKNNSLEQKVRQPQP